MEVLDMKPKLYDEFQETGGRYSYQYRGTLTACQKCEVNESRNSPPVLSLETTVNDDCADLILSQRMIRIKPNPFDAPQFFEIKKQKEHLTVLSRQKQSMSQDYALRFVPMVKTQIPMIRLYFAEQLSRHGTRSSTTIFQARCRSTLPRISKR
jgi:phage-related protein